MHTPSLRSSLHGLALVALAIAGLPGWIRAVEPTVLAVAAVDGYADIRMQMAWLAGTIGQPALAVAADSMFMMATQGRGLNGLDLGRPLGVVVTTDGTQPIVHGYIPVKNLDKLLDSLQASIGKAERDGDVRRVALPSGVTVEFVVQASPNGDWAVAAVPGSPAGLPDPLPLLAGVADKLSLGIQVSPSMMPDAIRQQFKAMLDQAAARAAAQGQPVAPGTVESFVAGLADTESFALGMGIDTAGEEVFAQTSLTNVAGSPAAARMTAAAKGVLTVGMPAAANGARPAIAGHIAQLIPADVQPMVVQSLDAAIDEAADDPLAKAVATIVRNLVAATLGTGSLEAAVAVDTSMVKEAAVLPAVTLGVRVKDGRALEAQLKQALGDGSILPGVAKVSFDSGKAGAATLHTVRVAIDDADLAQRLGDAVDLTLAVAPEYAFVLTGSDIEKRAAAAAAASGKAVPEAKPIADLRIAVDDMLSYNRVLGVEPAAERGIAAAQEAGGGALLVAVRPVERGVATRLSADAAALKAIAAMAAPPPPPVPGLPAGVPVPQGFPIPLPVR